MMDGQTTFLSFYHIISFFSFYAIFGHTSLFSPPFCPSLFALLAPFLPPFFRLKKILLAYHLCPHSLFLSGIYRGNFVSSSPPFARALSEKICFRPQPHDENTNSILEKWYSATGKFNKLTFLKKFF